MSGISKVVYGNNTLIDISEDTVNANNLLFGETAHGSDGEPITGAVITHNVIDNLNSTSSEDALSAKQGKFLNDTKQNADKVLTGTLVATQTSILFTDASITSTALIDIYTDKFGVNPTNATQSGTTLTLTFDAQQNDLSVKVVIKGV